jgi:hypothetical protein
VTSLDVGEWKGFAVEDLLVMLRRRRNQSSLVRQDARWLGRQGMQVTQVKQGTQGSADAIIGCTGGFPTPRSISRQVPTHSLLMVFPSDVDRYRMQMVPCK